MPGHYPDVFAFPDHILHDPFEEEEEKEKDDDMMLLLRLRGVFYSIYMISVDRFFFFFLI